MPIKLAYLRDAFKFRNVLLVELPKGDMGVTMMREFLFDAYHHILLSWLCRKLQEPACCRDCCQGPEGSQLPFGTGVRSGCPVG